MQWTESYWENRPRGPEKIDPQLHIYNFK